MDYQGGGGGGGGFSGGGNDAYGAGSPAGGDGGAQRRNYDDQTCIPVTARMILTGQPDMGDNQQLKLEDDRKLYHIKLVGAVREVEETSTNTVYTIEDGTGLVKIKQWIDETDCSAVQEMREAAKQDNIYVKVVGQVKMYNGSKQILASSVRPLSTGNELAHHFLEVVYSGEKYKNDSTIIQPVSPNIMGVGGSVGGIGFGGGGSRTPLMQHGGGGEDSIKAAVHAFFQTHGGTFCVCSLYLLVVVLHSLSLYSHHTIHTLYRALRAEVTEYGVREEDCVKRLGMGSESQIRQAIVTLESEGSLYTTIDQNTYKAA